METEFRKLAGLSLILGSLIMVATMVLHPSGGDIHHLLKIKTILITSHSLAILSLPFIAFGFWGISLALLTKSRISILAFIISCFGLFAAMMAASINGLALPLFLEKAVGKDFEITVISVVTTYGHYLNASMDYILIFGFGLSISIWSFLLIKSEKYPRWIGYYGLILIITGLTAIINQYNIIGLSGFRIVVFGIISWVVLAGSRVLLTKSA